jgi:UDP-N-acetylmuramoylalanine--D-glutamate ligase
MTLFGYGLTTKALARLEDDVTIYDDSFKTSSVDSDNNRLVPSKDYKYRDEIEITSPGIPPNNFLIKSAKNLISEYDYFADTMPYSIWISGTNGKTTTTKMITHLLENSGAIYGGNVGVPLASMDDKKPIWVLETSSYTLHYTKFAKPNLYVLLPIEDDHISWHGSFSEYEKAKLKPISTLGEGEIAIVPVKYKDIKTDGFLIPYNNSDEICKYFEIDIKKVLHKEPFLLDALLALATQKIVFDKIDYDKINSFVNDEHRLQEIKDKQNRLWVNDSNATNIDATIWAIKRYEDSKIFLILGGDDKGADNRKLFGLLSKVDIEIFIIGRNKSSLEELSKEHNIIYFNCDVLENALDMINKRFKTGVALLSPAASSLDQFNNYQDRGNQFMEYINNQKVENE